MLKANITHTLQVLPSDKADRESAETRNLFLEEPLPLSIKIILAKFRATSKRVFDGKNLFTVWNIARWRPGSASRLVDQRVDTSATSRRRFQYIDKRNFSLIVLL